MSCWLWTLTGWWRGVHLLGEECGQRNSFTGLGTCWFRQVKFEILASIQAHILNMQLVSLYVWSSVDRFKGQCHINDIKSNGIWDWMRSLKQIMQRQKSSGPRTKSCGISTLRGLSWKLPARKTGKNSHVWENHHSSYRKTVSGRESPNGSKSALESGNRAELSEDGVMTNGSRNKESTGDLDREA